MRFEVVLQSDDEGTTKPFPGCSWNDHERRWEVSMTESSALVSLCNRLGHRLMIVSSEDMRAHGDLPILQICDNDSF